MCATTDAPASLFVLLVATLTLIAISHPLVISDRQSDAGSASTITAISSSASSISYITDAEIEVVESNGPSNDKACVYSQKATLGLPYQILPIPDTTNIMCGTQMAVEGLPLIRQVRGADDYEDILAGNDFLAVLMESTLHRFKKDTTIAPEEHLDLLESTTNTEQYLRETREANYFADEVPQTTERQFFNNNINTSDSSSDGVIIAVHVSSSVGSQINKNNRVSETTIQPILDQNFLSSDEHLSIVANNAKSDLNVEEPVPITKDNNNNNNNDETSVNRLQASIQNLPQSQHIAFNPSGFTNSQNKDNVPPFHHSLIYHDNPTQPGRARSVSYSTIIQDIQPTNEKTSETLERKERNYETGMVFRNSFDDSLKNNYSPSSSSSSSSTTTTTEKNWPKPYAPAMPKIYGRPEQNYEVEEAVSVETNGRTHGIQSGATQKPQSDQDKDQKVGYVVEGRNYRKYRVEERTPDGFIVGEYGVVSHDDGSLRGVRYTADGTINPRLIYDALMKFLAL